jgi:hypothetical protein
LHAELGAGSIQIVEHRFPPRLADLAANGRFNVEWVTFKNDARGLACARWWRDRCNEWCFARAEPGRFGDQKYLDEWPERFEGVQVLAHIGGGLAPWNHERWALTQREGGVFVDGVPLVFFHYHAFQLFSDGSSSPCGALYEEVRVFPRVLAREYVRALQNAGAELTRAVGSFSYGVSEAPPRSPVARAFGAARAGLRAALPPAWRERVSRARRWLS